MFKLLSRFLVFVAVISLVSCDDESTDALPDEQTIIGEWELLEFKNEADITASSLILPIQGTLLLEGKDIDVTMTFNDSTYVANGSLVIVSSVSGIPLLSGTSEDTINLVNETGRYEIQEDKIVLETLPINFDDLEIAEEFLSGLDEIESDYSFNGNDLEIKTTIDTTSSFQGNNVDVMTNISYKLTKK